MYVRTKQKNLRNTIYAPGKNPNRWRWDPKKYNARQEHIYQALSTITYAHQNGRLDSLQPTPGSKIDMEDFAEWKERAFYAWKIEARSMGRGVTRGLEEKDLTEASLMWLYQRIKAAPPKAESIARYYAG